jgi:hypothetical protein
MIDLFENNAGFGDAQSGAELFPGSAPQASPDHQVFYEADKLSRYQPAPVGTGNSL